MSEGYVEPERGNAHWSTWKRYSLCDGRLYVLEKIVCMRDAQGEVEVQGQTVETGSRVLLGTTG